jgi:hypothetical protein
MNRTNVAAGLVCVLFGAVVYWLAQGVPDFTATDELGGRFLPQLVSILMMLTGLALMVTGWLNIEIQGGQVRRGAVTAPGDVGPSDASPPEPEEERDAGFFGLAPGELRIIGFIAVLLAYTLALPLIGYLAASIVAFAALILIAGERRPLRIVLGALGIAFLLYGLFGVVFQVHLPTAALLR